MSRATCVRHHAFAMDERTALAVTAVKAVETADRARVFWTDADRAWASRAAAEVEGASAIARRFSGAARAARARAPRRARAGAGAGSCAPRIGGRGSATVVVAAALQRGRRRRPYRQRAAHQYPAPPVLSLVLWNLAVYVALASVTSSAMAMPLRRDPAPRGDAIGGGARGARTQRRPTRSLDAIVASHAIGRRRQRPLCRARRAHPAPRGGGVRAGRHRQPVRARPRLRVSRDVGEHVSRCRHGALAAGVVLRARRAGSGIVVPDVAHIAAIRAPASENAALWLHLMAATLAVSRSSLAWCSPLARGWSSAIAQRIWRDFDDPYFARLLRDFHEAVAVRMVPYSFAVTPAAVAALETLLARALGAGVTLAVAPRVAYGDEDVVDAIGQARGRGPVVALFNATATPERETHGQFLAALARSGHTGAPVLVIVDEAAFNARWRDDQARREARRRLWRDACAEARLAPVFVDLAEPDLAAWKTRSTPRSRARRDERAARPRSRCRSFRIPMRARRRWRARCSAATWAKCAMRPMSPPRPPRTR